MDIAIILARGGSKRIPRKNVRSFHGRPMIAWAIAAAKASGCFARIVVSTDDPAIAEIAAAEGAEVPFLRPADLSGDHVSARAAINHAIAWVQQDAGQPVRLACCLYGTAAFARARDLRDAQARLQGADPGTRDFVFAAAAYPHPVHRALRCEDDGTVEMLFPDHARTRTQDLPDCVHDLGLFYWGHAAAFLREAPMFSPRSAVHVMPRARAVDIDTPEDWDLAERLFAALVEDETDAP